MANHKSAKKRARQETKRQERNRDIASGMRTLVKQFRSAVESGDESASERLKKAESAIRRAASKGVIPQRRASRSVSRLSKALGRSASA